MVVKYTESAFVNDGEVPADATNFRQSLPSRLVHMGGVREIIRDPECKSGNTGEYCKM